MRIEPLISTNGGTASTTHLIVNDTVYPADSLIISLPKDADGEFTGFVSIAANNLLICNSEDITTCEYRKKIDGVYQSDYGSFNTTDEFVNYLSEIINPIIA